MTTDQPKSRSPGTTTGSPAIARAACRPVPRRRCCPSARSHHRAPALGRCRHLRGHGRDRARSPCEDERRARAQRSRSVAPNPSPCSAPIEAYHQWRGRVEWGPRQPPRVATTPTPNPRRSPRSLDQTRARVRLISLLGWVPHAVVSQVEAKCPKLRTRVAHAGVHRAVLALTASGSLHGYFTRIAPLEAGLRGSSCDDWWPTIGFTEPRFERGFTEPRFERGDPREIAVE